MLLLTAALFIVAGMALMLVGAPSLRLATAEPPLDASQDNPTGTLTAVPSPTSEPLIPTRTAEPMDSAAPLPTATPAPTSDDPTFTPTPELTSTPDLAPALTPTSRSEASPTPSPTLDVSAFTATAIPPTDTPIIPAPAGFVVPAHERFRLGISLPGSVALPSDLSVLRLGWVMDWAARSSISLPPGVAYMPTVRMSGGKLSSSAPTLTAVAAARPGSTWLISNEPDVRWQDNVDPATYARLYYEAYQAIKAGDPSAVVAVGGIAQPTPLRLRYLDLVLQAYQAEFGTVLPAQAWHIHNYMLREERNSWGVDIPPGIADNTGVLYSIDDSGNLNAFRSQIYDFRRWMVSRGYGGQPLIVSEFGVPMPEDYGFSPERMAEFLRETWRFFLTAADAGLGDPSDGGRLVQRWCWFSLYYTVYPTGNLIDANGRWTALGQTWISYVSD
ncbi:MAG: hypothetical protein JXR84_10110 [Anaerolineae bacterium]|nr:hypothetical protein [Anaerolineae bacterium]